MTYPKSLTIGLKADTRDSDAKLKDTEAKVKALTDRTHDIKLDADDKEGLVKLKDFSLQLDKIGQRVARPNISVDGIDRADLALDKLSLKMDRLNDKGKEAHGTFSKLASALGDVTNKLLHIGGNGGNNNAGNAVGNAEGAAGGAFGGLQSALGQYGQAALWTALIGGALSIGPAAVPLGLGLGVGGAGVLGAVAMGDKSVTNPLSALEKSLESVFGGSLTSNASQSGRAGNRVGGTMPIGGTSFVSGLGDILKQIDGFTKTLGPDLADMFRASLPFLQSFTGLLEQSAKILLPAFTQSMQEIRPELPQLMQGFAFLTEGVADFIKDLGPGMRDATTVFKALMDAVKGILIGVAYLADAAAVTFANIGHWAEVGTKNAVNWWHDFQKTTNDIFNAIALDLPAIWDRMWRDTENVALGGIHLVENYYKGLFDSISNIFDTLRHDVATIWDAMWTTLRVNLTGDIAATYNQLRGWWHDITGVFDGIKHDVLSVWDSMTGSIVSGTRNMVNLVGSVVHGIEGAFSTPIHFAEGVWDHLADIWNGIAGKLSGALKLPTFAAGGVVTMGTTSTADDVLVRVSKGETILSANHSSMLAPLLSQVGVPGYAAGGVPAGLHSTSPGVAKNGGGGILGDIGSLISSIASWSREHIIEALFAPINAIIGGIGGGVIGGVLGSGVHSLENALAGLAQSSAKKAQAAASTSAFTGSYGVGVSQWTPDVLRVMSMLGLPSSDLGTVLTQMMTESGGNPNAINLTDSNAAAGDPSRGLMQTIMSTFEAYRSSAFPNDI